MGALRKRLNAKEIKGADDELKDFEISKDPSKASQYVFTDVKSAPQVDPEDAARIALFQSMINNLDWFIKIHPRHFRDDREDSKENLWNTIIVEMPDGRWILFPQDFSLAGILIGSPYITLNKLIFGYVPEATQVRLKQNFIDKKPQIYSLLNTLTEDPKGPELMKKTLDAFYLTIE